MLQAFACGELTTDDDNIASQKVIEHNGGVLVGEYEHSPEYESDRGRLYRITLPSAERSAEEA